jgi:hypothetical protein
MENATISPNEQSFLDQYDASEATGKASSGFITKVPEKDSPLIVKFVVHPKWPIECRKLGYFPIDEYRHRVGSGENDIRTHPDLVSLHLSKESPEKTAYVEARRAMRDMDRAGQKDTPAYKKLEAQSKLFEPSTKGWFLVIKPNSDTVECVKLPKDVINKLWGKKATQFSNEVPSLIEQMRTEGRDPYNPRSETGWVEIFKEGTSLGTRYTVREWVEETQKMIEGQRVKVTIPRQAGVKLGGVTVDKLPNPVDFFKNYTFTLEEARLFVSSGGTAVPARFLKEDNVGSSGSVMDEDFVPGPAPTGRLDDIPF